MNYEFTGETKVEFGIVLRRIVATVDFKLKYGIEVHKGETGGWIEKKSNLSDDAWVSDEAEVYDYARVCDDARVLGNARVLGDARVKTNKDFSVFKNTWSSFRWFTYTRSNK